MLPLRILIADDHEVLRRSVRSLVSCRSNWSICGEATDGIEAVEKSKKLQPDVVLMDVSMPGMDGFKAARIIRRDVPTAKVIIVSQNDPAIVRRHAVEADAHGYVEKANLRRDLIFIVEQVTQSDTGFKSFVPEESQRSQREWLFSGGQLGHLIRQYDWTQTPLGAIEHWSHSLRTAVNLMLNSQHPMWIGWGREMIFLYNDAYISVLSTAKHPKVLGRPAREVWPEIWDYCGPLAEKVFARGEATLAENVRLFMDRGSYLEETYYSFSYSPVYDQYGGVAGLFCPSAETTATVLHARRLHTLSELSAKALVEKSVPAACRSSLATLAENPDDIPFALLYLIGGDAGNARLAGVTRIAPGDSVVAPEEISLQEGSQRWPINQVMISSGPQVASVENMQSLASGPAEQRVKEAILLPLAASGQERPLGILIAGVNPTRRLDAEYQTFFQLVGDQVVAAIQNAKASEEDKRHADALAEIDRAKTAFFSNVSHEFRTPLTLMLGPLEDTLAGPDGLPPKDRERLEVAYRNSLRLLKLVNTLLDFSRIEAGRFQMVRVATDIAALTAELASVFRSAIERAGMRLIVNCGKIAGPIYVDREMWEKILFNLLSNAFKFTLEGEIEVSLRPEGDAVKLAVRDTGTGIPATEIPHLFERFHQVKGARGRTFEGSGIGLALVQELVKLHGGSIAVESELGRGTTFTVSIPSTAPAAPDHSPAREPEASASGVRGRSYVEEALRWLPDSEAGLLPAVDLASTKKDESPQPMGAAARILLADDNADMRDYLQRMLAIHYQVTVVADGESALAAAQLHTPDLVLTDVMMPRLDGFGLLKALRANERLATVPVILLSARAGEEARVEGISAGADDYLIKPFSARELMARIDTHLNLSRLRHEAMARVRESERQFREMIDALPAAIYTTDPEGRLTHFNPAAVEFSGRQLELGTDKWCVSWKIFSADGQLLPHDQCPMAVALKEGKIIEGGEFIAERPDGKRIWFSPYPRLLRDENGRIVAGLNMLVDITERKHAGRTKELLAAIVGCSDDAIVSKDLDGIITSWNQGAERLFGYTAEEAVGQSITLIIPSDRLDEERNILNRLKRGQKVEHFETVRVRKDGTTLDISLTISPLKDDQGRIVGASKVARDITGRKRAEAALADGARQQRVLFQFANELHRAKSLEEVYRVALDAICGALLCDRASILLFDDHATMRFVAWRELSESYRTKTEGHSPWQPDEAAPDAICIPDIRKADLGQQLNAAIEKEGIGSLAFIPLISLGKLIGKFMVYFNAPHTFTTQEVDLGLTISRQLAFGIERRKSEEALRRSEEQFRTLARTLDAEVRVRTVELEQRNTEMEHQSDRLRDLSQRLMQSRDDERRRIARELHDSAGQTLTVLSMSLARIAAEAEADSPDLARETEESQNLVQQLSQEIRTMSYLLHPPLLDESGLSAALQWYTRGLVERSGLAIQLEMAEDFGRLPREMELVVFRVVQECLTNIHRHSESRSAIIRLTRDAESVFLEVEDSGKGMSPERLSEIQSQGSGVGIRGMLERIRQFGGKMNIESGDSGTKISVTLPLSEPDAATPMTAAEALESTH